MAFAFLFESNFEAGSNAEWDSESDTGGKLDFPHYTTLANIPGLPAPFRGAYCMRIDMGDTNAHTVTEGDIDIADGATAWFRFYLYAASNVTATADDTFNIFELQQAGGTVESALGMRITAATNLLEIGIGDGTAPTDFVPFPRGKWVSVELKAIIHTTDGGALELYLDGGVAIALADLDNAAAVGQGVLGTTGTLSTTSGTLLFDQFVMDDARVYPITERYPQAVLLTKSSHVFVGPGRVDNVSLLSGAGTDCVLSVYDTDTATTNDAHNLRLELKNVTNSDIVDPAGMPLELHRGCYVTLSGTTPRALILLGYATGYGSDGAIRTLATRRKARLLNT